MWGSVGVGVLALLGLGSGIDGDPADLASAVARVRAMPSTQRVAELEAQLEEAAPDPEGRLRWSEAFLAALESEPAPALEASLREWRFRTLQGLGRLEEAGVEAEAWAAAGREAGDALVEGDAVLARGIVALSLGQVAEAEAAAAAARALYASDPGSVRVSNALSFQAGVAYRQGDYARATELFHEALAVAEERGDRPAQLRAWNNLGLLYKGVDSYGEARHALERAVQLAEEVAGVETLLAALSNLASVQRELGEEEEALAVLRRVLALREERGDAVLQVYDRTSLGLALAAAGERAEAILHLERALAERRELGLTGHLSRPLYELGRLLVEEGRVEEGLALLEEALAVLPEDSGPLERDLCQALVEAYLEAGRIADSAVAFERFIALARDVGQAELSARNAELHTRYAMAVERRATESSRAQAEIDRLAAEEGRTRFLALLIGCALLAILCGTLVLFARTRARLNRDLEERNRKLAGTLADLRRALEGSVESERLYRHLFEDESHARILLDPETGAIAQANPVARRWLAPDGGSVEGQSVAELAPELDLGQPRLSWQPQGASVPLELERTRDPVRIDGRHMELVTLRDVTDLRRLEEEQHRSQMLSSLSLLAAGIAHDFNNALTAVLGNVSVARSIREGPKREELLEGAEEAAAQAGRMADQLLAFARGGTPVMRVGDLSTELERWISFSRSGSGVEVSYDLAADLWPARFDEGQLAQVFYNLVLNAQDAMGGRGTLTVSASNHEVRAQDEAGPRPGPYVRVTFQDSGPGIAEGERERVFEPYYSSKADGRGLGLPTSYSILQRHGGALRLLPTRPGEGAAFEILVPADPEASLPRDPDARPLHRGEGRVLIVDDEPEVRAVFSSMLGRLGYQVCAARHLEEALERLDAEGPFDLAVIDATIPGSLGGAAALRQLRAAQPGLGAILTSGYSDSGELARHHQEGFDDLLKKPFQLEELATVVTGVLAKR